LGVFCVLFGVLLFPRFFFFFFWSEHGPDFDSDVK